MLSLPEPEQAAPPFDEAGLSQVRERDWVPPPHVTLHEPQEAQEPQLPSTETYNVERNICIGNVHISKRHEKLTISRPSTIQIGVHSIWSAICKQHTDGQTFHIGEENR